MRIGPYALPNTVLLAPMAGVTDRPFRQLCRAFSAGYAVGEMLTAQPDLRVSRKTRLRLDHASEPAPVAAQIMGVDPAQMADAARHVIGVGAHIIDINMGCPARKVCQRWAGSALMRDEPLALAIIEAVIAACAPHGVPVTLKMRTGWDAAHKNAVALARAAESAGVQMVAVHGRTREQGYRGQAEYDTAAAVKAAVRIPVAVNGDIDTPGKARAALDVTRADAVMIGRAALGQPWLFREVTHYLATGQRLAPPLTLEVARAALAHLDAHHDFYGEAAGVRSARKHAGWLTRGLPGGAAFSARLNTIADAVAQRAALADYFAALAACHERLPTLASATVETAEAN
ncbi:MAG: tRNA dihydrouridine synthase DusB [Burkholderiaceae bacterium]|jgi:tRNA-dihydrouridine synthase B|nr:tRNA dihydrouridine synthase DusB [Burkholderiaceae bacterium]